MADELRRNGNGTVCLVQHPYRLGQKWENDAYIVYVMDVHEDVKNEAGEPVEPGCIVVMESRKPRPNEPNRPAAKLPIVPGKAYRGNWLSAEAMDGVVEKGGFVMTGTWLDEFQVMKDAQLAVEAAAGTSYAPPTIPDIGSGIGLPTE